MEYQLLTPRVPVNMTTTPVEQVFANRGFTSEQMEHYLHTTKNDVLDPALIANVNKGAKMLIKHLNDKIFVQVDSDADGFTSAAAFINYLNLILPGRAQQNISYRIHEGKQHGIIADTVPEGTGLVVIPDAGSNDYNEHKKLADRGIDVLVIDHHEADKISEYACVINNQLCDYPTKSLSGVGMVYKFCSYIDKIMGYSYAEELIDLVALGIVADVMDLSDYETHYLVSYGINHLRNPFFSMMVKKESYSLRDAGLTPFGISFYIAPAVNATIRVGSAQEKLVLFESMLDFKAYELIPSTKRGCKEQMETRVEQACRNCTNVKNRQTKIRDTSIDLVCQTIEEKNLLDHSLLIVPMEEPIEKAIVGLVANQIASKYQKPTLILNKNENKNIDGTIYYTWEGSGRNTAYSKLLDFRGFLEKSGYVEFAQGHASAFGVSIKDEHLDELIAYVDRELSSEDFSSCYYVDFIWNAKDTAKFSKDVLDIASHADIWGQGIEEPKIAIEGLAITKDKLFLMSPDKNPTLKIKYDNGIDLIKFRSSKDEYESLLPDSDLGCVVINIIGTCKRNVWNGLINPQIAIEDYEVVSKAAYYF